MAPIEKAPDACIPSQCVHNGAFVNQRFLKAPVLKTAVSKDLAPNLGRLCDISKSEDNLSKLHASLHVEHLTISKLCYRMCKKMGRHEAYQGLRKVNRCVKRYIEMETEKMLTDLSLNSFDLQPSCVPTCQMIQYGLVRLQGAAILLATMAEYCYDNFMKLRRQLYVGHLVNTLLLFIAAISRVWLLSRSILELLYIVYDKLYVVVDMLPKVGPVWLPDSVSLPVCLKGWMTNQFPLLLTFSDSSLVYAPIQSSSLVDMSEISTASGFLISEDLGESVSSFAAQNHVTSSNESTGVSLMDLANTNIRTSEIHDETVDDTDCIIDKEHMLVLDTDEEMVADVLPLNEEHTPVVDTDEEVVADVLPLDEEYPSVADKDEGVADISSLNTNMPISVQFDTFLKDMIAAETVTDLQAISDWLQTVYEALNEAHIEMPLASKYYFKLISMESQHKGLLKQNTERSVRKLKSHLKKLNYMLLKWLTALMRQNCKITFSEEWLKKHILKLVELTFVQKQSGDIAMRDLIRCRTLSLWYFSITDIPQNVIHLLTCTRNLWIKHGHQQHLSHAFCSAFANLIILGLCVTNSNDLVEHVSQDTDVVDVKLKRQLRKRKRNEKKRATVVKRIKDDVNQIHVHGNNAKKQKKCKPSM